MKINKSKFNGKECCWYSEGKGPALIFIHGFLESSLIWKSYSTYFSKSYRVICIDLPGHGNAGTDLLENKISVMSDLIAHVLKQEQITRAIFVGHSMGGYAILSFLERYSELCLGLVLMNTTSYADNELKKMDRERAIKVLEKNPSIFINEAIPNLFFEANRKQFANEIDAIRKIALQMDMTGAIACLRGMKNRKDQTELLRSSKTPVLFIAGTEDNVTPLDKSLQQIELSGFITPLVLKECGHMGFLEKEIEVRGGIEKFVKEVYN